MNKRLLTAICFALSIKILSAADELESDINEYKRICSDSYGLRWEKLNSHDSSGYFFPETLKQQYHVSVFFFNLLINKENYEKAFMLPTIYKEHPKYGYNTYKNISSYMPEVTVNEVIQNIKIYIRNESSLIFERLLHSCQFSRCYEFSIKYRDVFSTVDVEHTENIRGIATGWLTQIHDKTMADITKLARTLKALIGVPDLELDYRTCSLEIINSFPIDSQLHTDLQTRFDEVFFEPRAVPDASRLTLQREMVDRLFS